MCWRHGQVGACSAVVHVDMFKPWMSLASNTLAMRSSKTCMRRCPVIISVCHLSAVGSLIIQSIKLSLLNWHALCHHLAELVNTMTCAQAYMCFFRIC